MIYDAFLEEDLLTYPRFYPKEDCFSVISSASPEYIDRADTPGSPARFYALNDPLCGFGEGINDFSACR